MLGVKATLCNQGKTVHLTQPRWTDDFVSECEDLITTQRAVSTPLPPGAFIQRTGVPTDEPEKNRLQKLIFALEQRLPRHEGRDMDMPAMRSGH